MVAPAVQAPLAIRLDVGETTTMHVVVAELGAEAGVSGAALVGFEARDGLS
jgi:hypothetical protein